ncbi:hypothetical protein BLNAU_5630 [Blattamonas nauphoetae]|uniref:Uncharacterized protein n=1 Tax=Blattamonas nauphoetae TaxID=2049346 RepID=A0ABQ9Y6D0_9EUKA|nr:hypothetical protein BLNAU_5630 [Blattamonas nauphoetae]
MVNRPLITTQDLSLESVNELGVRALLWVINRQSQVDAISLRSILMFAQSLSKSGTVDTQSVSDLLDQCFAPHTPSLVPSALHEYSTMPSAELSELAQSDEVFVAILKHTCLGQFEDSYGNSHEFCPAFLHAFLFTRSLFVSEGSDMSRMIRRRCELSLLAWCLLASVNDASNGPKQESFLLESIHTLVYGTTEQVDEAFSSLIQKLESGSIESLNTALRHLSRTIQSLQDENASIPVEECFNHDLFKNWMSLDGLRSDLEQLFPQLERFSQHTIPQVTQEAPIESDDDKPNQLHSHHFNPLKIQLVASQNQPPHQSSISLLAVDDKQILTSLSTVLRQLLVPTIPINLNVSLSDPTLNLATLFPIATLPMCIPFQATQDSLRTDCSLPMRLQQVEILLTRPSQSPSPPHSLFHSCLHHTALAVRSTYQPAARALRVFKLFFNWTVKPQGDHPPLTADPASQLDMTQSEFESELVAVQSDLSSLISEQTTPKATLAVWIKMACEWLASETLKLSSDSPTLPPSLLSIQARVHSFAVAQVAEHPIERDPLLLLFMVCLNQLHACGLIRPLRPKPGGLLIGKPEIWKNDWMIDEQALKLTKLEEQKQKREESRKTKLGAKSNHGKKMTGGKRKMMKLIEGFNE